MRSPDGVLMGSPFSRRRSWSASERVLAPVVATGPLAGQVQRHSLRAWAAASRARDDRGVVGISGLTAEEVSGVGRAGELLAGQPGQEQQRAARSVADRDVLGLPGSVL